MAIAGVSDLCSRDEAMASVAASALGLLPALVDLPSATARALLRGRSSRARLSPSLSVEAAAHRRVLAWCRRAGWGEVIDDQLEGVESLLAVVVDQRCNPRDVAALVVSGWDIGPEELRIDCVRVS
jgi:DNA-binding IclR family transcriptional regulator